MIAGLLTAEEAAARLGVKPTTLYAYVSRGHLRRQRGPDGRSRFALAELDRLARRRVAVPARGALDPLRYEPGDAAVVVTARRLIAALVDCLPGRGAAERTPLLVRPGQPFSGSIAARLWTGLGDREPPQGALEALNGALVLVADHELSVST